MVAQGVGLNQVSDVIAADNTGYVTVRLPSGEQRLVLERCMATIGSLSNAQHKNRKLGRAGANRWLGRRPTVRGVAMNSVDHPHGGGRCGLRADEQPPMSSLILFGACCLFHCCAADTGLPSCAIMKGRAPGHQFMVAAVLNMRLDAYGQEHDVCSWLVQGQVEGTHLTDAMGHTHKGLPH